jgi:phospholipase C
MYWMTGMIDPEATGGGPILRNVAPPGGYTWTTYAERLEKAGVSWKVYQQEDGHGHSMLQNFKAFRDAPPQLPQLNAVYARLVQKRRTGGGRHLNGKRHSAKEDIVYDLSN